MNPYFHTDAEEIQRKLHLGNLDTGSQPADQFDAAVEYAITKLWTLLGKARLDELVAIVPATGNPTTNDEYVRAIATQVEEDLVRYSLAGSMPIGFSEGQVDFVASNRSEGSAFQEMNAEKVAKIRDLWWNDPNSGIASKLSYLLAGAPATQVVSRVAVREAGEDGNPARVVFPPEGFFGPTLTSRAEIAAAYTALLVDF